MRNCAGSTSQNISTTNWESQCIAAVQGFGVPGGLLYTSLRHSQPTSIYGPSLDMTWSHHVNGSALSVVGPLLSLVRQSGTRYRTVSVTRRSHQQQFQTIAENEWTYFVATSTQSALERCFMTLRYIDILTFHCSKIACGLSIGINSTQLY